MRKNIPKRERAFLESQNHIQLIKLFPVATILCNWDITLQKYIRSAQHSEKHHDLWWTPENSSVHLSQEVHIKQPAGDGHRTRKEFENSCRLWNLVWNFSSQNSWNTTLIFASTAANNVVFSVLRYSSLKHFSDNVTEVFLQRTVSNLMKI